MALGVTVRHRVDIWLLVHPMGGSAIVAQMASHAGPGSAMAGVLTVADLLNRCAPARAQRADERDDRTAVISVSSLLRREGRAPEADTATTNDRQAGTGRVVRRSVIAAGTLLAVGSVFGAAVITDSAHSTDSEAGGYPGEGRLDADSATAGLPAITPASTPVGQTLDPGI